MLNYQDKEKSTLEYIARTIMYFGLEMVVHLVIYYIFKPESLLILANVPHLGYGISNTVATFINKNYYVLNSHIELLKEKDNFKNCRFFYIGVQEQNNQNFSNNNINNGKNEVYEKIRKKQEKSSLKVKLFEFINDTIFHVDLKLVDPEKLKYLYVLKDEFNEIRNNKINTDNKLLNIENKIVAVENQNYSLRNDVRELKNVIYIMLAVIICLVSLLIMINFKKL